MASDIGVKGVYILAVSAVGPQASTESAKQMAEFNRPLPFVRCDTRDFDDVS
jgi:hypothetical protein